MPALLVSEHPILAGRPIVIEGRSPGAALGTRFEDDGATAYFYALDLESNEHPVVDSMLIYHVAQIPNRAQPMLLQVIWSTDGQMSGLLLDGQAQAIFDFKRRRGYCRSGMPPAGEVWSVEGHDWNKQALERLLK